MLHLVVPQPHPDPSPVSCCPLSQRELEVLAHMATGASTQEVADILSINYQTAKNHLWAIMKALNVSSRTGAVVLALKNGWIAMPGQVCQRKCDQQKEGNV